MNSRIALLALIGSLGVTSALAQDWPQWRGPNRDAKAADFKAPKTWPKELTQKWKVTVGDGVATPALVGGTHHGFGPLLGAVHHLVDVAVEVAVQRVRATGGQRPADQGGRDQPPGRDAALGQQHRGDGGHEEQLDDAGLGQGNEPG